MMRLFCGETPWRLKSVMRQLCQGASRMALAPLARKMLPLLAGDETRWACMAYQAISLDDEPMLEAMAEEMTHDNLPGRGIHLAGCRLQPVATSRRKFTPGKWVDYEIKMSPWLNTASAELCPQAGQVELYIWGSFAKDVLPFSWFDNEARQAFRRWEIPEYIRPGRYLRLRQRSDGTFMASGQSGWHPCGPQRSVSGLDARSTK